MFDLVMAEAKKADAKRVGSINLVIGEMTGVVGDCVRFYLDFLSKDTIAENAVLNIRTVPTQAQCRECGKIFEVGELQWACPECGNTALEITAGKELFVESIEVE
jgi:hydrogenase nickel incorporation protein HypA/HybF